MQECVGQELSLRDFNRLSKFIHTECGIKMPHSKKTMLEVRLHKRMRATGFKSLRSYCDFLFSPEGAGQELVHMIDAVTTNKTDFFREPAHFSYLTTKALGRLIKRHGAGIKRNLLVWSAGCSSGEEPYTLAIVLEEFARTCPGFQYSILATDISTKVLDKASLAVYDEEKVAPVPQSVKRTYFMRSKRDKKLYRVAPELRKKISFMRLNFMEEDYGLEDRTDIIFCRNVVIYFDRKTQERLLNKFSSCLIPGGYLFMGHSETLHGLDTPFIQEYPTVYRNPL